MNELTEQSISKELGLNANMISNIESFQFAEVPAGGMHTFFGKNGGRFLLVGVNSHGTNSVNARVYHSGNGRSLVTTFSLRPLTSDVAKPEMTDRGVRVYNNSGEKNGLRPNLVVVLLPIN